ncbi:predicted protein [Sclerotinia sclerotiorum 1980 UF-70]|uniref:Uncharacterized protein n=1 Tax=Sclerotinia sclerotiorum (strain ATCC 18683 / 1980 / Ss-1) TaxID=665079 RepID=A7EIP6_SCLS1|nr:predicted protein [Sclerotinia sclerotiorum 1980 UF-70]EDO02712.1 predicted protein [Sclerotinia sclerotiorum 1980 UF-70]
MAIEVRTRRFTPVTEVGGKYPQKQNMGGNCGRKAACAP